MYVSKKDLETISELSAFVAGALESAEDHEYWFDLDSRTNKLEKKMHNQYNRQEK